MKKLVFAATVAAALTGLCDVSSANTVGYTTRLANAGFRIICPQFESTSGGTCINDIVGYTSTVAMDGGEDYLETAPQIQLVYGDTYISYYLVTDAQYELSDGSWTTGLGWVDESGWGVKVSPEYVEKTYCMYDGVVTPGTGIWFKDPTNPATITANGQVCMTDTSIDTVKGFRIRATPFPIDTCLNDENMIKFFKVGTAEALPSVSKNDDYENEAPQIQLVNGDGYITYYYVSDADYEISEGSWGTKAGWIDESGWGTLCSPDYVEKTYSAYDGVIKAMTGFWARGTKDEYNFTMKFIAPIK